MRWSNVPKMFVSLMVALFAAVSAMAINEIAHQQSTDALDDLREAQLVRLRVNQLIRYVLDAETGQRGFLLTASPRYLEPYNLAMVNVGKTLEQLDCGETLQASAHKARRAQLSAADVRHVAEMQFDGHMRKKMRRHAWRSELRQRPRGSGWKRITHPGSTRSTKSSLKKPPMLTPRSPSPCSWRASALPWCPPLA